MLVMSFEIDQGLWLDSCQLVVDCDFEFNPARRIVWVQMILSREMAMTRLARFASEIGDREFDDALDDRE